MKYIKPKSNTKVVLMTRGNFDLHFTPVEAMDQMAPYHFAVEVEDWHGFLAHLRELGIRHTRPIMRPEVHGSGPGVVFVHGSGGHHAAWWQQVAALRDDYSVITMDLRGFGCTRWTEEHDARSFPGDIIAVLDAVAEAGGPDRSVLIGQSIGAAAALRAALSRPDRASGAVLAHSLGGLRHEELTALVKADRAEAEKLPVLDRLLTPEFRARRPDLAFLFRQMGTFNTAKMADLRNLNSDGPTAEEVDAAPFPVMLLAGEKDAVLSPGTVRRAGELLENARVQIVPGAPHSMYWETPDLFNEAVRKFLAEVYAG